MMKLAKISRLTREDVSLNLDEARGNFSSSKSKVEEAQARLDELQKEFEELQENFGQARSTLLELNHLAQVMDLTGAEETRDRKGQRTFMIGGKEHEVDASDVNDIRCTPYSRKKEEDEDSNATDDVKKEKSFSPDVSLADDPDLAFASDIIESTAKLRFR